MIEGEASMKQNIIYVGPDVDDAQYYGSALDKNTGEVIAFKYGGFWMLPCAMYEFLQVYCVHNINLYRSLYKYHNFLN